MKVSSHDQCSATDTRRITVSRQYQQPASSRFQEEEWTSGLQGRGGFSSSRFLRSSGATFPNRIDVHSSSRLPFFLYAPRETHDTIGVEPGKKDGTSSKQEQLRCLLEILDSALQCMEWEESPKTHDDGNTKANEQ